ncbi:menaquinone biosynthetic enzyme MqnA/MqnD family protein [Paenibacillus assamensis]|uniref:menaquinone biosynthetic enzyme MqnA/MqnD family protein n=1 Tax=Paenibacillus assamensis TaxID=311244 RepID=UPI00055B9A98|nr:menaquinone biosynthesis protein [Paenibacillus assamensis]
MSIPLDPQKRTIRIGQIDYTNVWPIFFHFKPEQTLSPVELIPAVPSTLNKSMKEGNIDMGPISAFAYGESSEDYVLFPDLSVSAYGAVNSILLFLNKPLIEALEGTVALTTSSATSINLFKIIAEKRYGAHPSYISMDPQLDRMMEKADAALLIGDHAIRAYWDNERHGRYQVLDLGQMWQEWTGHWMTFAVWAVRKQALVSHPSDIGRIVDAFERSKYKSIHNPDPLIQSAVQRVGGTEKFWRNYFANLNYDFGPRQQQGLQLYFKYAYELGLIDHHVQLDIWSENKVG